MDEEVDKNKDNALITVKYSQTVSLYGSSVYLQYMKQESSLWVDQPPQHLSYWLQTHFARGENISWFSLLFPQKCVVYFQCPWLAVITLSEEELIAEWLQTAAAARDSQDALLMS